MFWHWNIVLRFQRILLTYTIPLLFIQNIFLTCFDFKISHLGPNDYPRLVLDPKWNFSLDLKHNIVVAFWETKCTYFCSKMLYGPNFAIKSLYGHWKDCIWTKTLYLNVSTQKYRITVLKVSLDLVYTITLLFTHNFFLTSFDFKISHLGSNDYSRIVLKPKWNFGLYLKHNIFHAFWEPKVPIFVPKIQHSFLPQKDRMDTKRIVFGPKPVYMFWHRNIVLWFQTILLTLFIQFLYSLFKTFSSHVLTSKSLIWVLMITLGFFWT